MHPGELTQRLIDVLGVEDVRGLERLSRGASRETWSFETIGADAEVSELIPQRQRVGSDRDMDLEARAVRAAFIGRRVCENEHDLLLLLP